MVVLARLGMLVFWVAVWGLGVYSFLRALAWLARRNWIYALTIRELEAERVPDQALLFLGSSTIRLWDSMARDLAPWPVVNRGFGGAVVSQVVHYAPRLVPASGGLRAIVLYCGGNDLAWFVSVDEVVAGVERFLELAKQRAPETPVYLLSVGKTPSRRRSWRRVEALNRRLEELAKRAGARFVDVTTPMCDQKGRPRRGLYLFDGIHPSPAGYAVWTSVLRARFEADFG